MLLEFSVTNFRSFKEKQTLSTIPATNKKSEQQGGVAVINDKLSVLKSAVIYGANASGKSNFIKALQVFRRIILKAANQSPLQVILHGQYFLFEKGKREDPTEFEVFFLMKNVRYRYHLSVQKNQVVSESLYCFPNGRSTKLFDRKKDEYTYGDSLKGNKKIIESITNSNQLYLSKAALNNSMLMAEIFIYFQDSLKIYTFTNDKVEAAFVEELNDKLHEEIKNETFKKNKKFLLTSFNTGVRDFKFYKSATGRYDIWVIHNVYHANGKKSGHARMRLQTQSLGTQKLFYLNIAIIDALMNGKTLIFDEFERSLHPHISSYIIQMFNNPKINKNNAQLIVATHDTNLINKENGLRRDQIWLVEKDKTGASELFSLSDIEGVRQDTPFEKWYLSGRFGAVPNINSLDIELNFQHETPQVQEA